jgi:hypothetical protein
MKAVYQFGLFARLDRQQRYVASLLHGQCHANVEKVALGDGTWRTREFLDVGLDGAVQELVDVAVVVVIVEQALDAMHVMPNRHAERLGIDVLVFREATRGNNDHRQARQQSQAFSTPSSSAAG